ncbi:hypothetical protein ACWEKR_18320 [Nocardia sp. NPDC004573]
MTVCGRFQCFGIDARQPPTGTAVIDRGRAPDQSSGQIGSNRRKGSGRVISLRSCRVDGIQARTHCGEGDARRRDPHGRLPERRQHQGRVFAQAPLLDRGDAIGIGDRQARDRVARREIDRVQRGGVDARRLDIRVPKSRGGCLGLRADADDDCRRGPQHSERGRRGRYGVADEIDFRVVIRVRVVGGALLDHAEVDQHGYQLLRETSMLLRERLSDITQGVVPVQQWGEKGHPPLGIGNGSGDESAVRQNREPVIGSRVEGVPPKPQHRFVGVFSRPAIHRIRRRRAHIDLPRPSMVGNQLSTPQNQDSPCGISYHALPTWQPEILIREVRPTVDVPPTGYPCAPAGCRKRPSAARVEVASSDRRRHGCDRFGVFLALVGGVAVHPVPIRAIENG